MSPEIKPEVASAIDEIRRAYPSSEVEVTPDPDGGAYVKVSNLHIGSQFNPATSWCLFRITFQYPFADVYPHYFVDGLQKVSGEPQPQGIHVGNPCDVNGVNHPATMVSRRSNRLNPATDTAALKLQKVLDWIRTQ
ncbi:MAG: hypothetical protein QM627_08970 [Luteolibacter sp.]